MKKELNFSNGSIIIYTDTLKFKVGNKFIDQARWVVMSSILDAFIFMKMMIGIYPPKDAFIHTLKEEDLILPNEEDYNTFYDILLKLDEQSSKLFLNKEPQIPSTPPSN